MSVSVSRILTSRSLLQLLTEASSDDDDDEVADPDLESDDDEDKAAEDGATDAVGGDEVFARKRGTKRADGDAGEDGPAHGSVARVVSVKAGKGARAARPRRAAALAKRKTPGGADTGADGPDDAEAGASAAGAAGQDDKEAMATGEGEDDDDSSAWSTESEAEAEGEAGDEEAASDSSEHGSDTSDSDDNDLPVDPRARRGTPFAFSLLSWPARMLVMHGI